METKTKTSDDNGSGEKENSNGTPVGVKFPLGIPGKEIQNKNRADMPPRSTSNLQKAGQRGGGNVAGRGFGRGRGQNHGSYHQHASASPGKFQGHHHNNSKSRGQSQSPKTSASDKSVAPGACDFCDRPCTEVICSACGYEGANLRVKKECPKHPRIIRVADLEVCPQCKTGCIEETSAEKKK